MSRYDVELMAPAYALLTPVETIQLMRRASVFFGVHGASWQNVMFMHENASTIQMGPFGWEWETGNLLRGDYFKYMAWMAQTHYFQWVNWDAENAFFRQVDFDSPQTKKRNPNATFVPHPLPDMGMPSRKGHKDNDVNVEQFWYDQSTFVNMTDFLPVLEAAIEAAGIHRRADR
jgi:hypothetical protein